MIQISVREESVELIFGHYTNLVYELTVFPSAESSPISWSEKSFFVSTKPFRVSFPLFTLMSFRMFPSHRANSTEMQKSTCLAANIGHVENL
jgi:hypothetical protein